MPIINRIAEFHDDMTAWRRDFHAHPELAFEEERTSGVVARLLGEWGLEVHTGIGKTGVVGVLRSGSAANGRGGRAIGLRADMDALAMTEQNSFEHASRTPGVMHACGHDGHTAMLLGAARYLAETRNFDGTVYFIFQPAEEGHAGGYAMLKDGLFERFPCDQVFGLHNWPEIATGKLAVRTGPMMAAADEFSIQVHGKGGHAAMPHHGIDPVLVGAHIVTALQSLVSRNTDPVDQAVISVTQFHAGSAFNVIPNTADLNGTVRTFEPETRDRLEAGLARLARSVAEAMGATAEVEYRRGYPPTINTAGEAELAAMVAEEVLGAGNVDRDPKPCMGAEDFAFMLEERPGSYVWLGQAGGASDSMVHSASYDFNDEILPIGASYWVRLAETLLPTEDR